MKDFNFYTPTQVAFGRSAEERLPELVKRYGGTKVLVHYGGGSARRSGLLDKVFAMLDATGGSLMRDLALTGGVTLAKAIRLMADGALPPEIPQVSDDATFAPKLKKTDGLIDWTAPVLVTERRIRAYHPWPCCYTFLPQRLRKRGSTGRIAVLKAEICPGMDPGWREAPCGTVVKTTREGPIVKCGDTALRLLEVKPEGSGAMSAGAFLLGRPLAPGDILGE